MLVLAAYDIANDRRRQRVSLCFEAVGARVQYSVFECELTSVRFDELVATVDSIIDHDDDQVRFYRLAGASASGPTRIVGRRRLEERQDYYIV